MSTRYFIEFVNNENDENIVVTLKLFSNSLPKLTSTVSKLLYNPEKSCLTYRKSLVSRVIAPEYLIQFGNPVRRSGHGSIFIDEEELKYARGSDYLNKINKRIGLICLASKDGTDSMELCILFVPFNSYTELQGYIVIGECKEWKLLSKWCQNIKLQKDDGLWERPLKDSVWVNRCGRLTKKGDDKQSTSEQSTSLLNKRKVRAVDLLFKKRTRK